MLSAIEGVLRDLELIEEGVLLRHCISISNGNTISVSSYLDGSRFFQVKVSEIDAFADEYETHLQGWRQFGSVVPKPIGRQIRDGWDVFVAQGVQHKPFIFDPLGREPNSNKIMLALGRYFMTAVEAAEAGDSQKIHKAFLDQLRGHFSNSPLASLVNYWVERGRALGICNLPVIPQHGDFVENNIGGQGDQLIIFDWEDFGKYQIPGLDVCSFCFSVTQDAGTLAQLMTSLEIQSSALGKFVHDACHALGIDLTLFRSLIPLYLLIFLHAKREYSPTVQSRIERCVRQLTSTTQQHCIPSNV